MGDFTARYEHVAYGPYKNEKGTITIGVIKDPKTALVWQSYVVDGNVQGKLLSMGEAESEVEK
jgi:hypothetical protein